MAFDCFHVSKNSWRSFVKELLPNVGAQAAASISNIMFLVLISRAGTTRSVAVYGLSNFFLALIVSPWTNTTAEVGSNNFAIHFGAKAYDKVRDYFYKMLLIEFFIFAMMFLLSWYSGPILRFMGIDAELASRSAALIIRCNLYQPMMHVSRAIQSFMGAQKTANHFYLTSLISISLTYFVGYYFIQIRGMVEMGVVPAKIVQEGVLLLLNVYFMVRESQPECVGWPRLNTLFNGIKPFAVRIVISSLSVFMDYVSFEYNTYLAAMMHSVDKMALWESYISAGSMFYYVSQGFSAVIRARVGHMIGNCDLEGAKKEAIRSFFYTFIVCEALAIFLVVFADPIAWLFLKDPLLQHELVYALYFHAAFLYFFMMLYPLFSVMRLLSLDSYFFKLTMTFYPAMVFVLNTSLVYYFDLGVMGLYLGNGLDNLIMCLIFMHKIFWLHNWERDTPRPMILSEEELEEMSSKSHMSAALSQLQWQ